MNGLEAVATGVYRYADGLVNWYMVDDDGLALYDCGWPRSWPKVERALQELGRRPSDIRAVVLTHGHADHLGAAESARKASGAPVFAYREEVARVRGERKGGSSWAVVPSFVPHLWRPPALRFVLHATGQGFLTPRWVREVTAFEDGDQLDVPGRPRVLLTPGHTEGHVSYHLADHDVVVAGDALVTLDPLTGARGPRLFNQGVNWNPELALESLARLEGTAASFLLPGHGEP